MDRREPTDEYAHCGLCTRWVPRRLITLHHLVPRQLGGKPDDRVSMCRVCHKQVHATFSNRQLIKGLATIEAIRSDPRMAAFMGWIVRQKPDRLFRTVPAGGRKSPR